MIRPTVVAVIPARSGSKGLSGKNVRRLGGKPMLAHTVLAARRARMIDRVVLSTDSNDIAAVGRRYGADVPFLRPAELARDDSSVVSVLAHAVTWLEKNDGMKIDVVVLLQPTSPLRGPEYIDAGTRLLLESGADSVVGLCEASHSPHWMYTIRDGRVEPFLPDTIRSSATRRQDLPPVYLVNGAFYASRRTVILEQQRVLGDDVRPLVMPPEVSVDVDTPLDLLVVETILRARRQSRIEARR